MVEPVSRRPVGRPRNPELDDLIRAAALELLAEGGRDGCGMDDVARRANVGKATIYRRWATKEDLLIEVLGDAGPRLLPLQDHGSAMADVVALLADVVAQLWSPAAIAWRRVVPGLPPSDGLTLALPTDPLPDVVKAVGVVASRAARRGESSDGDGLALVLRAACATIVHAWLVGDDAQTGHDLARELAALLVEPRLVRPSAAGGGETAPKGATSRGR